MKFEMLTEVTVGATILIIAIFIIRKVFETKLNFNARYFLWAFVALRILIPFNMELSLSDTGWAKEWERLFSASEAAESKEEASLQIVEVSALLETPEISELPGFSEEPDANMSLPTEESPIHELPARAGASMENVATAIWLSGVICLSIYIAINNLRFCVIIRKKRKQVGSLLKKIPVYELEGYNCLLGILKPAVYVDQQVNGHPGLKRHVILHELQHYRAKDNLWTFARILCLVLQWYNPLVWAAYFASGRDCELACDYRAVKSMDEEERLLYSESLLSVVRLNIKARSEMYLATSMGKDKKFLKKRMESIMKGERKKIIAIPCVILLLAVAGVFINFTFKDNIAQAEEEDMPYNEEGTQGQISGDQGQILGNQGQALGNQGEGNEGEERYEENNTEAEKPKITVAISDHYITNTGDPSNLYYIDDQNILWGCGRNQCGQLGQGTQDYDFHEEMVKIAENVIHVDYSQYGLVIYLTQDNKLYGFGNNGGGAIRQISPYSGEEYINGEHYSVTEPVLLMEDVVYARCGKADIAALKSDASLWIWGMIWYRDGFFAKDFYYQEEPVKVLENAVLVTGGFYNHAALLEDGSLWTWGYNYAGNCGIPDEPVISVPQRAAEGVSMVWTDSLKYNVDCFNIADFGGEYERRMENTVIRKTDGSYWICGVNVGNEEKVLPEYHEVVNYSVICTHEFLPFDMR